MLIFLDIDGVMVAAKPWANPLILEDGFAVFGKKATEALNKILAATNATIVLTTSHKHRFSLEEWTKIFETRGVKINKIKRLPENNKHQSRKEELLNWFHTNKIEENFVILDDDKSLNDLPKFLKDKLILTSPLIGLTPNLANQALAILSKKATLEMV